MVPVAVVVAPLCASVTGTTTSRDTPLMLSLPATCRWVLSTALTLVDWKVAWGNLGTLNHSALGSSASVSREPMVALPVSMESAMLLASTLAGSNATCALNFLKWPSMGTPIWRTVNAMLLCAGSSCCCCCCCCAAAGKAVVARQAPASSSAERVGESNRVMEGTSQQKRLDAGVQALLVSKKTRCGEAIGAWKLAMVQWRPGRPMRASKPSRSTKWCLSAAATCSTANAASV